MKNERSGPAVSAGTVEHNNINSPPKARRLFVRIITGLVSVSLVVMALLVFLYRDRLSAEALQDLLGRNTPVISGATAYSYENGTKQTFALAGDGFALASASGVQLLDNKGATVVKEICSMETPAVAACPSAALFFDIGGDTCRLAMFDGSCQDIAVGDCIISASLNENAYFAVISEESGSKGLVQAFDPKGALLYQWYSGTGYPLSAQISPDNRHLAVLCLTEEGSVLHVFQLNSEKEQASCAFPGEVLFELRYLSAAQLCLLGSEGMHFVSADGSKTSFYDFDGRYLSAYDFGGSGFAALYLSEYRAGAGGQLLTLDGEGTVLGQCQVEGSLISLSAQGRQVLFAASDGLSLYSQALQRIEYSDELVTAKQALLRPRGDVLLLSSYAAEPFDF